MYSHILLLNTLQGKNKNQAATRLALPTFRFAELVRNLAPSFSRILLLVGLLFTSISNSSELTATQVLADAVLDDSDMCVVDNPTVIVNDIQSTSFDGNGPLIGYVTNNASALPDVVRRDGRYHATLLNNDNDVTLHFNDTQGRLDAKRLSFPFEFIARNIGIGTLADSQVPPVPDDFSRPSSLYMFAGIQVHVLDLDKRDSAHFVVGHRGSTSYTVEGKNTVNGRSRVNDAGQGIVPSGRADLRVVGNANRTLTWYWQQPNANPQSLADDWIAYRGNGSFPGQQADFGDEVYVGLITYAFNASSVPFVGTCDAIEWIDDTP